MGLLIYFLNLRRQYVPGPSGMPPVVETVYPFQGDVIMKFPAFGANRTIVRVFF
jgi:hypothetical protein